MALIIPKKAIKVKIKTCLSSSTYLFTFTANIFLIYFETLNANSIDMRKTLSSNSYTFQLHQPQTLKTDPAFKHDLFPYMHRYQQMTSLYTSHD